jgi:hypothetical protein
MRDKKKAKLYTDINSTWKDFRLQEINEATTKHPTQDEVERINEFIDFLDSFSWGLSGKAKELFSKLEKHRAPYFNYAFGDKSPWKRDINKKGSKKVQWDNEKAKKLGI